MNRKHAFVASFIITIFIFFIVSSGATGYFSFAENEGSELSLSEEEQKSFYTFESLDIESGILLEKDYEAETT